MKKVLTIAGSDSGGGAGIQADIKTMTMNGVFAMSAVTALTAQNTTGVQGIFEVTPEFLAQQIDSVFTDLRPDAVKIGMVSSSALITVIAERLRFYPARRAVERERKKQRRRYCSPGCRLRARGRRRGSKQGRRR